ncbi:MAG: YlxR family protein [Deltaproteobacteria bacterium]|nr:YlxR family protein [Deltaproteobacteria bacterium]
MPSRKCLGCGVSFEKALLVRFVVKDGALCMVTGKDPGNGRGAYVCGNKKCAASAIDKKGAFARALKANSLKMPSTQEFLKLFK